MVAEEEEMVNLTLDSEQTKKNTTNNTKNGNNDAIIDEKNKNK
jgi:hypothetical protein